MWTKEQFEAWKAGEANQGFLKFVLDSREALMADWADGRPMTPENQATAVVYGDLLGLQWADVADFYGLPIDDSTEEGSDGRE